MPESAADTPATPSKSIPPHPLEILLSAALAGLATYAPTPNARAVLALLAPPTGYVMARLGRWVVNYWIPKWMAKPTPEQVAMRVIESLEKKLKSNKVAGAQKAQLEQHLQQLRHALHERTLKLLEVVSDPPASSQP